MKKFFFILFLIINFNGFCQDNTPKKLIEISGKAHLTNNGISLIPTFSLEKPATIFDFSFSSNKISFDPELSFSLKGKPWFFLFWWRYKIISNKKFNLKLGVNPSLDFKEKTLYSITGIKKQIISADRFFTTEIVPNYKLSENISFGLYYLLIFGLDNTAKTSNFLTFNTVLSNIKLTKNYYLKIIPQVYYLKMDKDDGYYATSSFTLSNKNYPFSLSSIINKVIKTEISGSKSFNWNLSLIYSFDILKKTPY